ncbi:MAG: fibronectin type III domain-containing protein, partial [Microcystis sp. LE18-22.4A]
DSFIFYDFNSNPFTVNVTVVAPVPGKPTGVAATPGSGQASVVFTAPASDGGSAILDYTVTSNPGGFTKTGAASPLTVTGLSNGTAYTFTVTARNANGSSAASDPSSSVTPKALQTITFNPPGTQTFGTTPNISGLASATSGLTVTFTSTTTGVCTITTGGVLTFITAGSCTINADQAGNATYSAATTVPQTFTVNAIAPGAPTAAVGTAGDTQVSVAFTAPVSNGGSSILDYTVTSSPGGATATGAASPLNVTGLTNGTAYTFTVTARNTAGNSLASTASTAVTPKAAQNITFGNPGTQTFGTTPTLTATASSNLTVTFTSTTTGVCTITSGGALTFVTAGSCTINADQAGNAAFSAATTVPQTFTVNAIVPGAPTAAVGTPGDTQVSVAFTAPVSNGGSAILDYTVTASPGGATATGAASPINVTGLTNGTAYTFTVTARNSAGSGSASTASTAVTPKAAQSITFNPPGAQTFGTTPTLTASASSTLPVTFTSTTTGVCTITSGGALTFVTAGSCTINADQAGNAAFSAATTV